MKLSKHQLRRVLRKVIKEHVTDEHHEHPHAEPHRQLPQTSNKSEAEDLLHDTLLHVEQYLTLEEIEAIIAQLY